jgi:hypothetical protein
MIKSLLTKTSVNSRMMFSTAVNHTPPLKLFGVNGRYATALYISASKVGFSHLTQLLAYIIIYLNTSRQTCWRKLKMN